MKLKTFSSSIYQLSTIAFACALTIQSAAAQYAQPLPLASMPIYAATVTDSRLPIAVHAPVLPPLPIEQVWTLEPGVTVGQNLKAWAHKAGWDVLWQLPKDWVVPARTSYTGDFASATEKTIQTLADNGALVHLDIFEGNKTAVISGPGQLQ